jgi:catechol 2,3-dioxygenase-like lactoylglutathione lyase family enzyme
LLSRSCVLFRAPHIYDLRRNRYIAFPFGARYAAAVPIERLDHVQLAMPPNGEDAARAFYRDALGIDEVAKPPHLAARGGCWFERGALKVHLGVEADFRPARKAHPAFIVSDLATLIATLKSHGYSVVEDQPLEGYDRVYVDDPFGNRIELMEPLSV